MKVRDKQPLARVESVKKWKNDFDGGLRGGLEVRMKQKARSVQLQQNYFRTKILICQAFYAMREWLKW